MPGNEKQSAPSVEVAPSHPQRTRKLGVVIVSALLVAVYLFQEQLLASFSSTFVSGPTNGEGDVENWTQLAPGTVKWWDCRGENGAIPGAECGYIIVPTDYFNEYAGVTKIALGRYKAKRRPYHGMVLVNPGGPGGPGKPLGAVLGSMIQTAVTSETYDIVGFDPRGIGETEPATRCFTDPRQQMLLKLNTVLNKGFNVGGNLSAPELKEGLLRQQIEADGIYRTQFALCAKNMGEKARYMGTSTVVRDIDFMTKTLAGEDALINYWGGSYGSILGQYLVNMLPDRIGRVAIDGIADAVAWSNEPNYKWYRTWLSSTEAAYDIFLNLCAKAGDYDCPLTLFKNEEPYYIRKRLEEWIDSLYEKPLIVDDPEFPGVVTAGMARTFLLGTLEAPRTWPTRSAILAAAIAGEGKLLLQQTNVFGEAADMSRQAVSCNDAVRLTPQTAASHEEVLDEYVHVLKSVTKLTMAVVSSEPDSGCQYWPVDPPERFSGPWNQTLRNPIVVFSNTADPVTPISSARLVKALLGDSAVLALQNAPGHCTLSLPSICTLRKARAFFEYGALPEDGHVCEISVQPFPDDDELHAFSGEDAAALEAGMRLGEYIQAVRRM
ncbi:hypothetical protein CALCODRAFT_482133 [Calocera cornea HHB12733]|uniref:Alpha/beta-hydrolase n=1 Tax=Calocera cornea HHB12733 TaxID=1353952 RepID=A0A165GZ68_9BASI|nr:hypothetical protein CALCODRAFT_482133 [Calocera cornea HHB12733]